MIRCRNLAAAFLALVPLAAAQAAADSSPSPPVGRYRCYEPPAYTVVSWFDFDADGTYRFNGGAPARYRYDAERRLVTWLDGELASGRQVGIYVAPVAGGQESSRYVIALSPRPELRPGSSGWKRLVQCYLTTH